MPRNPGEPAAQLAVVLALAAQIGFESVEPSSGGEDAEEQADGAAEQARADGDAQGDHGLPALGQLHAASTLGIAYMSNVSASAALPNNV